ncbi:hypothetical protein [Bradyrhizobium septentrionale]|uniref:Uncharacterized protein n=1 Tax=Bradyrhizobium septentrionale TaxID=1404411 RepID=A0A973W8G5_9BRAD|nr:hypothetical protein [Bradyrhizobium septentrionale]UGY18151.1 hypothetical protein HAP48_0012375 [Bradyrhizobium septentrionale]UGY26852.1 hypothetical protein HU675_0008940 [Bradyrhizobium septentrionale]
MRLTGWVLLLIGAALCATISWAALGFLLMGVGLIALQVAERRRSPADDPAPAAAAGFTPPRLSAGLQPPTLDPVTGQDAGPQRQPRRMAWPDSWPDKNGAPYDREAWRRLVESDPDLAQLAHVLADYGPQYVDELAASYLAAPDKSRLGAIVDGIIARARSGQPVPPAPPVEASRPPPVVGVSLPPPVPPRQEPKQVVVPAAKSAAPPTPPSNPADALESSLLATVEEASARLAAERAGLFKPGREPSKATENRPPTANQREPLFGRAPRDTKPAAPPPVSIPMPAETPADLEASLIAAVSQAAAKRADTPKPPPIPERAPIAAMPEQDARAVAPNQPKPAPPAPLPPPPTITPVAKPPAAKTAGKTAADDLDETLLAALAEISGQKFKDEPKPGSPGSPADDGLSDMIKKFAPDSTFLRKQ